LRNSDVLIDVGANIGVYTVVALSRGAKALAFEPALVAREALGRNIQLNHGRERTDVFACALADFEGTARFTTDLENSNRLVDSTNGAGVAVDVRTLDAVLQELTIDTVTVLKVDVEGHDEAVLRGASSLLERDRPAVVVEIWSGGRSISKFLSRLGYRLFRYDWRTRILKDLPADFSGDGYAVAIHLDKQGWTSNRLATAPARKTLVPKVRWVREPREP
jgi:FkbM family methyltransferase